MERLTKKFNGGYGLINVKDDEQDVESKFPNTLQAILDSFDWLGKIEDALFDTDGNQTITLARLRELAEAEREGCVVALPFKIGDKAYWITHFGKMKASGTVVDILIRARDVLVGINTENGSGTRKSTKDILYFQGDEAARALAEPKGEHHD